VALVRKRTIPTERLPHVVRVPGCRSRGPGFDSRRYKIFWGVVGLERGTLSLVSITEELLGRNSNSFGLENREYGRGDALLWPRDTLSPQFTYEHANYKDNPLNFLKVNVVNFSSLKISQRLSLKLKWKKYAEYSTKWALYCSCSEAHTTSENLIKPCVQYILFRVCLLITTWRISVQFCFQIPRFKELLRT
jgi:hypothetical protein